MSSGLAAKLPLAMSEIFGAYDLITNYNDLVVQNLKMLILTAPGERMMDPDFGVGIRHFLFEQPGPHMYREIRQRISSQVGRYLPFIEVGMVDFGESEFAADFYPHSLIVRITFNITPLSTSETLTLEVNSN